MYKIELVLRKTNGEEASGSTAIYEGLNYAQERLTELFEQYHEYIFDNSEDPNHIDIEKDDNFVYISSLDYYFSALIVPHNN